MIGTVSEKEKASEVLLGNAFQGESLDYGNLPLSVATRFEPFSKYPYVVRDIAIWVPNGTEPAGVLEILKKEAGELAHKIWLFDRFEKAGRTSLAYRLIFQSFSRTLIEEEVNQIMAKIGGILGDKGFEIR
jgi:phenylalanyl-tRNA synthetase beta subunit